MYQRTFWTVDKREKLIILLGITLLAGVLRLHRIGSLPPGDRYDPAFYGVDALRVLSGERPIFFYDWAGQHKVEPLFSYLVAVCFLMVGPSTLGIHLAAALVGIATVPSVYLAAETLFASLPGGEGLLKRWGPLAAALMMAVSYWHLTWSRYGVRAILVPLFAALVVASLWRGLRSGRSGDASSFQACWPFLVCGALLGAGMYSYQAARLLPALVVIGLAAVAWRRGRPTRRDWVDFLIVTLVALLVFAPLAVYFLRHPESFSSRIDKVLVVDQSQGVVDNLSSVLNQVKRTILSFVVGVDEAPYRTLPGRPSLNPFFSVLMLLGVAFSLRHVKHPVYLFLLAWLLLLSIPAALAEHGAAAKRAIGVLPAVAMLTAVGALAPWQILNQRAINGSAARWFARVWGVAIVGGFVYAGVATYRDYFVRWASLPNLATHFEASRATIGDYAGDLPPDEHIYISPEVPSHPVIRFHSGLREGIQGYNGRVCLVVPQRTGSDTTYIISPGQGERSLDLLEQYMPQGSVVDRGGWHGGDPSFFVYAIPAGSEAELPAMRQVSARWGDRMQLLGYTVDGGAFSAGETIELTLYYRALQKMDQRYTAFVHLLGPENPASGGPLWAQDDREPCHTFYPTSSWAPGEIVVDRIRLTIPDEAPTDEYGLAMGFYEAWSSERLNAQGSSVTEHDVVLLGNVQICGVPDPKASRGG